MCCKEERFCINYEGEFSSMKICANFNFIQTITEEMESNNIADGDYFIKMYFNDENEVLKWQILSKQIEMEEELKKIINANMKNAEVSVVSKKSSITPIIVRLEVNEGNVYCPPPFCK